MPSENLPQQSLSKVRSTSLVSNYSQLSLWQLRVNDALAAFSLAMQPLNLGAALNIMVSFVEEEQEIRSFAQALDQQFESMGISLSLAPLSTGKRLQEQLVGRTHVVVLCSLAYAAKSEQDREIKAVLEGFAETTVNAMQSLLCAGGYEETAFKIVSKHYLVRDFRPMLDPDLLKALPLWIETVFAVSGYQGLGVIPDLLNLTDTEKRELRATYQKHYTVLEHVQLKAMVDYRLDRQLETHLKNQTLKTYFTELPALPGSSMQEMQADFLSSSKLVQLWLCPTKADTALTAVGLMRELNEKKVRTLVVDCADYPGKASWDCVRSALQAAGLKRVHEAYLKEAELVIIFTSYQALGVYDNLYIKNQLSNWKNVKIIVACQASFFKFRGYVNCFLPNTSDRKHVDKIAVHKVLHYGSKEA